MDAANAGRAIEAQPDAYPQRTPTFSDIKCVIMSPGCDQAQIVLLLSDPNQITRMALRSLSTCLISNKHTP